VDPWEVLFAVECGAVAAKEDSQRRRYTSE
jgi:hypothetical protein